MARRRNESLVEVVLSSNWPVSAFVAVFLLIFGYLIVPWSVKSNPVLISVAQTCKPLFLWAAGFFALVAVIKWFSSNTQKAAASTRSMSPSSRGRRPVSTPVRMSPGPRQSDSDGLEFRHDPAVFGAAAGMQSSTSVKPDAWSLRLIQAIEWKRFEDLCQKFYEAKGIRSAVTPLGPDGGIDIRLYQEDSDRVTAIVQCKAWGEAYVGVKPIRELLGVMVHEKVEKAFFMTTGKYSDEAKATAAPNRITLIDGVMFLAMLNRLPEPQKSSLLAFATAGDFAIPSCPTCGKKMRLIQGKEGKRDFWGCPAFPKCRQKLWARHDANSLITAEY